MSEKTEQRAMCFVFTAMLLNVAFQLFVFVLRFLQFESIPITLRYSRGLPYFLQIIMVKGSKLGHDHFHIPSNSLLIISIIPTIDVTSFQFF
jgi:hypothetical protein